MESILAMALEYTLKYWLKSFSRDQFKLQGRTFQLSNLDINGDALHASVGLPPAINVAQAKVGKLEIVLPSVSNVQTEPIAVLIDKLDLVLEETTESDSGRTSGSAQSSTSSGKASGYGFADKIADGMSLEVGIVNLMLETRGGVGRQGSATWASPLAAITIYNLFLYTTNENWQVVNLKEARDFSSNKKCIYVFKKLQWESLSVDLLPHPDMFTDEHLTCSENGINRRDDDGAKRLFFGGERFLDGISGEAYITVQRTKQNNPLGLEVQLHVTEAVCPALSEPGLRALLRFMTGLYVCLNRGDVDPKAQQRGTEAAGRSLVSIVVDHIFLCIKDVEFQLELLMQSLYFSRASISDGEHTKNISRVMVGGLFLSMLCDHWSQPISWLEALQFVALKWDTFSHPPCTLAQPSMQNVPKESQQIPCFGENLWPKIYPLGEQRWQLHEGVPLISLYSLQIKPSPAPPSFASQTVINCQPLMINLQEESCLRIASFLADGIVVTPGAVSPDFSVNSLVFTLKEFDLTVPLDTRKSDLFASFGNTPFQRSFSGARLHVEDLFFSQSPTIIFRLLNLHKDPACFCLWEDQPVDSSQGKWTTSASHISLSLETCSNLMEQKKLLDWSVGLWKCVELHDACFEAAMSTADGKPLITMPPPGGVVRIGVACQKYLSNTSVEQLFFVLDLYAYLGRVGEEIAKVGKSKRQASRGKSLGGGLMEKVPSDTAVSLAVNSFQLKFLESSLVNIQGMPLAQFGGEDLFIKVSHRTLGGAVAVSSSLRWESVQVDCVDAEGVLSHGNGIEWDGEHGLLVFGDECSQMRTIFWINNGSTVPFLEISTVHVIPYEARDIECHSLSVSAKIAGVRLGGGMNYTEALLHRFGILGPDGGPGEGLSKGLKNLSDGPLSKLLRASPPIEVDQEEMAADGNFHDGGGDVYMELGKPDNVEITIQLKDWLFALEGTQEMAEGMQSYDKNINREERCWHTTFQSLLVKAKSTPKHLVNGTKSASNTQMYPVELVTVSVEGLQALMPQSRNHILQAGVSPRGINQSNSDIRRINGTTGNCGGINLEVCMVISEDDKSIETAKWVVENLKFSVKQPIEAVATKEELEYVALLCRSEVDSMGRITAGILRVFKLEKSIGQGTIDQLSNLGSESLDKIFSPEKLSRRSSMGSFGYSPSPNPTNERNFGLSPSTNPTTESPSRGFESTVASLEVMVSDSQAMCKTLVTELSEPGFSEQHAADIKQLNQKLEKMQFLLTRLRTQI